MAISLKITTAAIMLLAAGLFAQTATHDDVAATTHSGRNASEGALAPTTHVASHSANPDPTRYYGPPNPYRPWLLPLGFYTLPVLILAVILFFKHRRIRMMHETLRAMIEKGQPVTPELVASLRPTDGRGHLMCYLLPGLICSAIGIGMMINGARAGLIPLLIGVAFLIAWQVEKRSAQSNQPPRQ